MPDRRVKPPPADVAARLQAVVVDLERLKVAVAEGRELRREFERRIAKMRSIDD